LSAAGLALVVLGILQSGTWGWLVPRNSPVTVFGFSLTLFVIAAGLVVLGLFRSWERHREARHADPLIRFGLFGIPALRSGLSVLLAQNLILLDVFFVIPLYLQVVQGLDAFQTGLRLLPVSIMMLIAAMSGPALNKIASPRRVARVGLAVLFAATVWLLATIQPKIDDLSFGFAMALLGLGMGLLASQLGNVVQSSAGEEDRSEVGGLQYTAQNLGSSLGTALVGSILIGALALAVSSHISSDSRVSADVKQQVSVHLEAGISFVRTDQVRAGLAQAGVPGTEASAIVDSYAAAQLEGLKIALLAVAAIALGSFWFTRRLPSERLGGEIQPGQQQRISRRPGRGRAIPPHRRDNPRPPPWLRKPSPALTRSHLSQPSRSWKGGWPAARSTWRNSIASAMHSTRPAPH
jgi:Na+/melibiose symporter-like transporter